MTGLLAQIRLAVGFLTILPVMADESGSHSDVVRSFAWFPLIGAAMGIGFAVEDVALSFVVGHAVRSTLIVLSMAAVSGAVHLDALADTADALGAGRDRGRALEILRDSRIGSFGAIALFFVLGLKVLSLSALAGWPRWAGLILAPTLARWSMVAVSYGLDYLRPAGAGSSFLGRESKRNLTVATIVSVVVIVPFISSRTLETYLAASLATLGLRWFYQRWLGGVTGDLIGACGEIVETLALLTIAR